jgi:hypothetical protein
MSLLLLQCQPLTPLNSIRLTAPNVVVVVVALGSHKPTDLVLLSILFLQSSPKLA